MAYLIKMGAVHIRRCTRHHLNLQRVKSRIFLIMNGSHAGSG
ncbi:hypothetical protein QFZ44_000203 [Pantoea agglomerans]|nr:hypothetical protein [Pantoea agglomerans]